MNMTKARTLITLPASVIPDVGKFTLSALAQNAIL